MKNNSRDIEYLETLRKMREMQRDSAVMLVLPTLADLRFRQQILSNPETMSYNHAWGGTIDWPEEKWPAWYDHWVLHPEGKRWYRYVMDSGSGEFVGEVAYHWDEDRAIWCADVIIAAQHRHKGYGRAALRLLCNAARDNGVDVLRDDIAIDNPAIRMFLAEGFVEEYRTAEIIMLRKTL